MPVDLNFHRIPQFHLELRSARREMPSIFSYLAFSRQTPNVLGMWRP